MADASTSCLFSLPDSALFAISALLSQPEQLALGRLVLQQGSSRTDSTAALDSPWSNRSARAAAAAVVLSHIQSCSFKLTQQSSSYLRCLHTLPRLAHVTLLVQQQDPDSSATKAVQSLAQLPSLVSLKIVRPQPGVYLSLTYDLAAAVGDLWKLQQLTLRRVCVSGKDTASPAACMQQFARLTVLTALEAPRLLSMVPSGDAAAAVQALAPILPQLRSLKLPGNSLEVPAVSALMRGLCSQASGSTVSSHDHEACRSCLHTLDLSGNHHMFAALANGGSSGCRNTDAVQMATQQAAHVRQGLAALVAGGSLKELKLADTGMAPADLADIFHTDSATFSTVGSTSGGGGSCNAGRSCVAAEHSRGQQLQRLDIHNNRLLATDALSLGESLKHLKVRVWQWLVTCRLPCCPAMVVNMQPLSCCQ